MHFRLPVAVGHVHAAIEIFGQPGLEGSVLHLAAAADEIFEAFLKREGKVTLSGKLLRALQEHIPELDRKTFYRSSTQWKNAVKHADIPAEDVISMPSTQPFFYLARAIMNYEALTGEKSPQMDKFMSRYRRGGA
jgi:hypothetical protein